MKSSNPGFEGETAGESGETSSWNFSLKEHIADIYDVIIMEYLDLGIRYPTLQATLSCTRPQTIIVLSMSYNTKVGREAGGRAYSYMKSFIGIL